MTIDEELEKRIKFLESKINQYLDTVKVNEKGENSLLWLSWINGWNNEIIELKKTTSNLKS